MKRTSESGTESRRAGATGLVVALSLFVATLVLTPFRYAPPAPAPGDELAASRILGTLRDLVEVEEPRPLGSPGNARLRDRVVSALEEIGLETEVQSAFSCNRDLRICGWVKNVVARLEGETREGAVLLAAHYDSVEAGPGISDNGVGVATLVELARLLSGGPGLRRSVVFLVDDGEESGLLGAEAFFAEHRWAGDVWAAVNLEARGSSGPSLMFETGAGSAASMALYADRVERPMASSLFASLYGLMPNDTDFSVFKRHGVEGFNLANIGSVGHYHSSLDTLENVDPATVGQRAGQALALVRGLAETEGPAEPRGEAVFFDVLAFTTIWWPAGWSVPLGLAVLGAWWVALAVLWRRGRLRGRELGWGLGAWVLTPPATLLAGIGLGALMFVTGALPNPATQPWTASPAPAIAAYWLLAFAVAGALALAFARRTGFAGAWAATWSWWTLLAALLAVAAPAAGFPFLVPSLLAAAVGLCWALGGERWHPRVLGAIPAVAAAVLWVPTLWLLYDALGVFSLPIAALSLAVLASTVTPLALATEGWSRRFLPLTAGALAGVMALVSGTVPHHSEDVPKPLNLVFHQDDTEGRARWLLVAGEPVPEPVLAAAEFEDEPVAPFPWSNGGLRVRTAGASPLAAAAPEWEVLADEARPGRRLVRGRLTSSRGASDLRFYVPGSLPLESVKIEGIELLEEPESAVEREWRRFTCRGIPGRGVEIEIVLGEASSAGKIPFIVRDDSPGLPPGGEALEQARTSRMAPFNAGDLTILSRTVTLTEPS